MDKQQIYVELQDYSCESRDLLLLCGLQTYLCMIIKYLPYLWLQQTDIDKWICQVLMIRLRKWFLFNNRVVTRCRTATMCLTKDNIYHRTWKNVIAKFGRLDLNTNNVTEDQQPWAAWWCPSWRCWSVPAQAGATLHLTIWHSRDLDHRPKWDTNVPREVN